MSSPRTTRAANQDGFTLIEAMISMTILLVVGGTAVTSLLAITRNSDVVTSRSDMRTSVRNAVDLMVDEIGQAGRLALPAPVTTTSSVAIRATAVPLSSTSQIFVGEHLVIDTGVNQETVTVAAIAGNSITIASATKPHASGAPVTVTGGFAAGVVPTTMANGSTGSRLKIVGDLLADGNLMYGEYWCDVDPATGLGRLYRNVMAFDTVAKPAPTVDQILVDNLTANPAATPCFTYSTQTVGATTYAIDVAVTLSVASQRVDAITSQRQTETRTVLNVAPRNVLAVRQLASAGVFNRIQPLPPSVIALLP
jgi:prepilin-type N-terminal cleavage/methylation domain-containing protein